MAEDTPAVVPEEVSPGSGVQEPMPVADAPAPQDLSIPTYHMAIWETPQRYICLPCNYSDSHYDTVVTHLSTIHSLAPVPSALVADLRAGRAAAYGLGVEVSMPDPTYRTEETPDGTKYLCLHCERAGSGHWSYDKDLFAMHMAQRHSGEMIPAEGAPASKPDEETGEATSSSAPPRPPDQPEEDGQPQHAAEASGTTPEPGV